MKYLNTDKITTSLKLRARKLFSKAFGLSIVASVGLIKKQFPAFDSKNSVHWFNLMDKCEQKIQADERAEFTPYEQITAVCSELAKNHGVVSSSPDSLCGYSVQLSYQRNRIGTLGFCNIRNQYYYSVGRLSRNIYFADLNSAVSSLMFAAKIQDIKVA
jgi:hypothetical protein